MKNIYDLSREDFKKESKAFRKTRYGKALCEIIIIYVVFYILSFLIGPMLASGTATLAFSPVDIFNFVYLIGINLGIILLMLFKYNNELQKYIEKKESYNKKEKSK